MEVFDYMGSFFSYISFFIYILIFFSLFLVVNKNIKNNGFNSLSMFILTFTLFYLIVPFIQTYFNSYKNDLSLFSILLNQYNNIEIFFNFLICCVCLGLILIAYNFKNKKSKIEMVGEVTKNHFNENNILFNKINRISDIIFIISVVSIILLIIEVGSISTYLSLGRLTRGLDKSTSDYIRSSFLQLVTASVLVLVPPYLYLYLYRMKKNKIILMKLIIALLFAVLFLLYNQGRAPLIVFLLPFIFTIRFRKSKRGIFGLVLLFTIGLFSLNYLDALFRYLAYGYYSLERNNNLITQFLGEFSYPFANFSLRKELLDYSGYRYMFDYFIWPFTMIPSTITQLVGLSKESIIAISTVNVEAYGSFLGIKPSGGIPVDFLTFNYYQFGYISLFISCIVTGRLLRAFDNIIYLFRNNIAIQIVLYRLTFSMINILNNADFSAIVRNRLDVVILLIILLYIRKHTLNVRGKELV